ncbi:nucleotidyltransferase family protein [Sulfitobacter sp.]|uniref:nucleotidyltransferase family protein n=1 Tax=Sulfitobacter sp. TaxID=1903071 RepID=UPI0030026ED3
MIVIVVLAAGASSRMQGRDKLMEDVDGVALLRRQVLRALGTGCEVLVTLPAGPHPRYDTIKDLNVTVVPVPDAAEGMNASLRAGILAVPDAATGVMVMLADMPDITEGDMITILNEVNFKSDVKIWRAVTKAGDPGHPIIFHKDLLPQLSALSGDQGGSAVVRENRDKTQFIPLPADHARTDLDTPEAWADWRARRDIT